MSDTKDGIPKEIKDEIIKACTAFGSVTLGFSYAMFGLIISIALIVLAVYKVISWLVCVVLIIVLIVVILLFMLLYQYLLSSAISYSLDSIKIPDLLNIIMNLIKIPNIPNIPKIPNIPDIPDIPKIPNIPNISDIGKINRARLDELSDSIED